MFLAYYDRRSASGKQVDRDSVEPIAICLNSILGSLKRLITTQPGGRYFCDSEPAALSGKPRYPLGLGPAKPYEHRPAVRSAKASRLLRNKLLDRMIRLGGMLTLCS